MAVFAVLVNVQGEGTPHRFEGIEAHYPRIAAAEAMARLEAQDRAYRHTITGCTVFRRSAPPRPKKGSPDDDDN